MFSHLTELKNICITEIYMKKQYKSSITKNHIIRKNLRAQPSTGETQEIMNNVSCRRDMTEILLKAA